MTIAGGTALFRGPAADHRAAKDARRGAGAGLQDLAPGATDEGRSGTIKSQ
jgi:hypothetical protein